MKIGIIRADRMGDMILTLPIIKAIKISNPSATIDVFCSNKNNKIIKKFKYVDRIYNIDNTYKKNKIKYDYLLNMSPGWKSFATCFHLDSKRKASIILTSRYREKIYSKFLIIILSKIFFTKTLIINRIKRFSKKISIHQTKVMFELLKICNIPHQNETVIDNIFNKVDILVSKKKICLIHLSSKWINKYYDESDFFILISELRKKFNLILTTDETTSIKFKKIFLKFPIINDTAFKHYRFSHNIVIFKNLSFDNWISAISSSFLVITPESGCTHIASICKIPSKIIYDADNKPHMINKEYSPWKAKYEKFIFDDKQLNSSLIKNL